MKSCIKNFVGLVLICGLIHLLLVFTSNTHVYSTLGDTIFKMRLTPSIVEHDNYPYRVIEANNPQEWTKHSQYGKVELTPNAKTNIESVKTVSFVIIHKDSLLFEEYWDGFTDSSISNTWSMAKSYVSMCIGAAITEGKIKSVNDKVGSYLPEYNTPESKDLTIKHLLTMTSGIDFGEQYLNPLGYMAKALYGDDVVSITTKNQVSYDSGTIWHYQGGNTLLLSFILEKVTGKPLAEYFSEKIWSPIGCAQNSLWSTDKPNGHEKSFCCVFSNAKNFAKIGQLMLNYGKWNGQQIIDSSYVADGALPINIPDREGKNTSQYGYAWWLLNYKGIDVFYARGILGQYTLVIPEKELVVIRLGHKRIKRKGTYPQDIDFYLEAALEMID